MTPTHAGPGWAIHVGHTLDLLRAMPDRSVRCCVTSPPYLGLRSYGTDPVAWPEVSFAPMHGLPPVIVPSQSMSLGAEPDPWAFVGHLVLVFREVRRVLTDDGTLWLNLGDSYGAANNRNGAQRQVAASATDTGRDDALAFNQGTYRCIPGLKPKDLVGVPWTVAFALQADGWYLRADCIWHKPNPMPESARDRPTKAHEYLFLLSKSGRYHYDCGAIKEPSTGQGGAAANFARSTKEALAPRQSALQHRVDREPTMDTGERNRRSVWTVATEPFSGAHFAVMPTALVEPCILAGTSGVGGCASCGRPWVRRTGRPCEACGAFVPTQGKSCPSCGHVRDWKAGRTASDDLAASDFSRPGRDTPRRLSPGGKQASCDAGPSLDAGVAPSCACATNIPPAPDLVLDPFSGAATVGVVSRRLRRSFVGFELNHDYAAMGARRIEDDAPLLNRATG